MLKRLTTKIITGALCSVVLCQWTQSFAGGGADEISTPTGIRSIVMENPKHLTGITNPIGERLIENFLTGLSVGGYYRGFFMSRKMTDEYSTYDQNKVLRVGEGQSDPMIFLYIGGNPTPNTSFGTEVSLLNPWLAYLGPGQGFSSVKPFFNMVLRGNINTKVGSF